MLVLDVDGLHLGERETMLLHTVARHAAMTIERSRMVRSMRKRSRHLACTPKLARSLTGQRDPAAVARIAARELHEGFGFGRISIVLVDETGQLGLTASSGMLARSPESSTCTDVMRVAFESVRPYVTCVGESDGSGPSPQLDDPNAPAGCRSQIIVPIVGHDHTCSGVIAVYERDPDALGEDDLHMLETIADQLAGTLEQAGLFETLERSYFKTVEALSAALEAKDAYTLDHARSITDMSAAVGRSLGMREDEIRDLKLGALLHDIGKIGVPGEILNKPGPLNDAEYEIMKEHTVIGEQIIAPIEFLEGVRPLVLHEHERWDGAGYPHQLREEEIPLGARIIFVCDAWHAMTSDRPYRKALPESEARIRLADGAGSQFDPKVVDAFLDLMDREASFAAH
jgi:HD-GYP domain-containing protein (c-di-GMP phosphodiesterase class II)